MDTQILRTIFRRVGIILLGVSSLQNTIDWYDFEVAIGATGATPGTGTIFNIQQYITDYEAAQAIGFLDTVGNQPFY